MAGKKCADARTAADNVNLAGYYNVETIRSRRCCCRNSFSNGLSLRFAVAVGKCVGS